MASYTCVSREWQRFFEHYTFNVMLVNEIDVDTFCRTVEGDKAVRLSYMQYIVLFIRLNRYNCSVCTKDEDDDEIKK